MQKAIRRIVVGGTLAAVVLATVSAAAEVESTQRTDEGDVFRFKDDPLAAGGFGPLGETIKIRERAARVTLIRPRTSFVVEMFKSIEKL